MKLSRPILTRKRVVSQASEWRSRCGAQFFERRPIDRFGIQPPRPCPRIVSRPPKAGHRLRYVGMSEDDGANVLSPKLLSGCGCNAMAENAAKRPWNSANLPLVIGLGGSEPVRLAEKEFRTIEHLSAKVLGNRADIALEP